MIGAVVGSAVAASAVAAGEEIPAGASGVPRQRRAADAGVGILTEGPATARQPVAVRRPDLIPAENVHVGSSGWHDAPLGTNLVVDTVGQIKAYASATSVSVGNSMDFHVSVDRSQRFRITIYRLGYYGGLGGRQMASADSLRGAVAPAPSHDPATGMIQCNWPVSWTLAVPSDWTAGVYMAVFDSEAGFRSSVPFVVRDGRPADICVVLPFATYQAYNMWPRDGKNGKSLYFGYSLFGLIDRDRRARVVSFDRPYGDAGVPHYFDGDHAFVRWVEKHGYDVTYATSVDLHEGRVPVNGYKALVFSGHDEYWSSPMRAAAERMVSGGGSLAFMMANNMYWRVRFDPSLDGRSSRVMSCYRFDLDPGTDMVGPTTQWRLLRRGQLAEQGVIGAQYRAIVETSAPLVISEADHWFWKGTAVKDGDSIPGLVRGEADAFFADSPVPAGSGHTLLSASPFGTPIGSLAIQNTSVYSTAAGGLVFNAGTFGWPYGLTGGSADHRVQQATANVLDRMVARRG